MTQTAWNPAALVAFLESVKDIRWLSHAGEPFEAGVVVADAVEGSDSWNEKMYEVWRPRTEALENIARREIGDEGIDQIFKAVCEQLEPLLLRSLSDYFGRKWPMPDNMEAGTDVGLYPELLDAMTRDLCWAAVEAVLDRRGFFTDLLEYYRAGRWPCAWDGNYPNGRVVVL